MDGRPRDPNAKRRATTRAERLPAVDRGSPELRAKRMWLAGDPDVGTDCPLEVLCAWGVITPEERDEGLRFRALSWWRYGMPHPSCAPMWGRLVDGGFVEEGIRVTPEESQDELARVTGQKRRLSRLERRLWAASAFVYTTAKRIIVEMQHPRAVPERAAGRVGDRHALYELARLKAALEILVADRADEDAHVAKKRSATGGRWPTMVEM